MQPVNTLLDLLRIIDGLIYPVPDSSADGRSTAFDAVPVFFQVTDGISHGMGILTDEHRFVKRADIRIHPFHTRIHLGIQVAETVTPVWFSVAGTFVMDRTCIQLAGRIVTCLEIAAAAGLISQAPEDDTRMIPVAEYHPVNPVDEGWNPRRHVTDRLVGMVFQVGLIHGIQSVIIEHGVHTFRIRIM